MRLDIILEKLGVSVVKQEKSAKGYIILLRVKPDPSTAQRWKQTVEEFLLAAAGQKTKTWDTDVSKAFFVVSGSVKFFWRVVFNGDVKEAGEAMGRAAMRSLASGVEVSSFPLVGRVDYGANGGIKGAHDMGTASAVLAAAFRP